VPPKPLKYGKDRRALLSPLAARHGLDYDTEEVFPGARPVQTALQLVGCGADLLSGLRYPDQIPTTNRKVGKSTAKLVARRFGEDQGRRAAIFLAQAFAVSYVELMTRAGEPASARIHQQLRDRIQRFFPLDGPDQQALLGLRAEYKVMEDHDIAGRFPATGYYMALSDPTFSDAETVDDDPRLVEAQEMYASRYLRLEAERHAMAICLGDEDWSAAEQDLFTPYWPGYEILEYDLKDKSWWTGVAERWSRVGGIALGMEEVALRPMRTRTASDLRALALELLKSPEGPMPEASQRAAGTFAAELGAARPVDEGVALEAIIVGYEIRHAETRLCNYNHFDLGWLSRLREVQDSEPGLGITAAGAALEVASTMPNAFSADATIWNELRTWAIDHVIQRAWQMHALGTEGGADAPEIADEALATAVEQGYGLRFAEGELAI
jgi:hypothetical protein